MTWFDILKNQVLSNTSLGSTMDWDNPEIEEEDDDCIKKLMEIYERAKNYSQKYPRKNIYNETILEVSAVFEEKNSKISEKIACEVLDTFKNLKDDYFKKDGGDVYFSMFKNFTPEKNSKTTMLKIYMSYGNNIRVTFLVYVRYMQHPHDENDDYLQAKKGLEYLDVCKEIFGEYYNSTYEEVFGDS